MRVFKWTPTFTPSKKSSIVPVWVSFAELPAHLFRKEVLFTVASMIGTPLQIDNATLNQSKLSKARACIELDLLNRALRIFKSRFVGPLSCSVLSTRISHTTARCANMLGIEIQTAIRKATLRSHPPGSRGGLLWKWSGAKQLFREVGESSKTRSSQNSFSLLRTPGTTLNTKLKQ
ncbi:UNVERIFIED_CONTAM: hypothetical protein Sindi_3105100 [Sesamum indicum]